MHRKRHVNYTCCIRECKNTYKNTSAEIEFYTFPKATYKARQCEEWKQWIRKANGTPVWEPPVGTRICSEHFVGNHASPSPLSPSYAPLIVTRTEPGMLPEEISAIKRFERSMERKVYPFKQAKCSNNIESPPLITSSCDTKSIELPPPIPKNDKCFQIFIPGTTPQNEMTFNETTTMICMQFVRNGVCEAQSQVFIPERAIFNPNFRRKKFRHKCVGTSIARIDKFTEYDPPNLRKPKSGLPNLVSIKSDLEMLEICGVTMETFQLLFKLLPEMPLLKKVLKEDRLFMLLTKLRTGASFAGMSVMYRVHRQTISKTFAVFLEVMNAVCERHIQWPSREAVRKSMPDDFKPLYGDCRVMIYCMKIVLQPGGTVSRVQTEVNYGGSAKFLVGWTPSGVISFVSSSRNGLTSDCDLVLNSGILDVLEPGDVILANKEFPKLQRILHENGTVTLKVIPPFLRDSKFSADEVDKMYQNVRVKNHYERCVRRLKLYKVLHSVSVDILQYVPDMFHVCCALANLQLPTVLATCKDTQFPCEDDIMEDSDIEEER